LSKKNVQRRIRVNERMIFEQLSKQEERQVPVRRLKDKHRLGREKANPLVIKNIGGGEKGGLRL